MEIHSLFVQAKKYIKKAILLKGLFFLLFLVFMSLFMLFVCDNFLRLPAGVRIFLVLLTGLAILKEFGSRLFWPLVQRYSRERVAVLLEEKYNIPDNLFINACSFQSQDLLEEEKLFAKDTIKKAGDLAKDMDLSLLMEKAKLRKSGLYLAGIVFFFVLYSIAFPEYLTNAFWRYVHPQEDIPPIGRFSLVVNPARNIVLLEGDSLEIECGVKPSPFKEIPWFVYQEGKDYLETVPSFAQRIEMKKNQEKYHIVFPEIKASFCWRIFLEDTYTPSFKVNIIPFPKIHFSSFYVIEPEYTGFQKYDYPGPPSSISVLSGASVCVKIQTDCPVLSLFWETEEKKISMEWTGSEWTTSVLLDQKGTYRIMAKLLNGKEISLAQNEILLKSDQVPQVEFATNDFHRIVSLGSTIHVILEASDDYGIKSLSLHKKLVEESTTQESLKEWVYLGPPGSKGPIKEALSIQISPSLFQGGKTYLLEGQGKDFCPGDRTGKSKPLLLKIKSWEEESLLSGDEMAKAFQLLQDTIQEQKKALGLTENFQAYLLEALKENNRDLHQKEMDKQQKYTKNRAVWAIAEFEKYEQGKEYARAISRIVDGEMNWVIEDILKLKNAKSSELKAFLEKIQKRQEYILQELIALLGKIREKQKQSEEKPLSASHTPEVTLQETFKTLQDDLKEFTRAERTILERSKTLLDKTPEDLTSEEEKILGELAREQEKWSKFLEEKLTDFSKLPLQDFSDASLAQEFNEVYQEIQQAAKSLYEKKIELAVPHEQSGLEKAETLIHNLEKWLEDTPDHRKWLMEEPEQQEDIPLAELPDELEDIVGELLDKEEEMGEDVEDVSSSWMDSLDKGAGWAVMDGPISNMSAKGVTGNLLPNKNEIGGRSGEGRTGKSHGQMVEKTAQGKGGRETPTRLSPGPFEQGSIEDTSKDSIGGATGGGKLSGFSEEGLVGPSPTPLLQKMARLAENQVKMRQKAEKVSASLKKSRMPSGDLEIAIAEMKKVEQAIEKKDGLPLRQAFSRALDALSLSKKSVKSEATIRREQNKLPMRHRQEIMEGYKEGFPKAYEKIISEYFKRIASE